MGSSHDIMGDAAQSLSGPQGCRRHCVRAGQRRRHGPACVWDLDAEKCESGQVQCDRAVTDRHPQHVHDKVPHKTLLCYASSGGPLPIEHLILTIGSRRSFLTIGTDCYMRAPATWPGRSITSAHDVHGNGRPRVRSAVHARSCWGTKALSLALDLTPTPNPTQLD